MTRAPTISPADRALSARRWTVLGLAAIVILTLLAYMPVLVDGGFIWDDDDYITRNPLLHDLDGLGRLWIPGKTHQYYPVVFTTFWVEYQLWGLDPTGYHLVNVLLHIANALLVWRIMRLLRIPGAWLIGAVFALHPVHVESVAWITERKNILSGLFYLLAALAYFRFDPVHRAASDNEFDRRPARRWGAYGLAMFLFVLALLSKSVTCSLPAALALVLVLKRHRLTIARLAPLVPMFIVGLIAALHTASLERTSVGAIGAEFDYGLIERLLIASRSFWFYIQKMILPWPVMFIYPRWEPDAAAVAGWIFTAGAIVLGVATVVALMRGRRGLFVALAFFAGTIFPALGFFNVYPHRYSFVADHFNYLASIGFLALAIASIAVLLRSERRLALVAVVILLPCFAITWTQSATYKSAETVWRDTIAKNDTAWIAYTNLSNILLRRINDRMRSGRTDEIPPLLEEARALAARSVELKPDSPNGLSGLAETYRLTGDLDRALTLQREAIAHAEARLGDVPIDLYPPIMATHYFDLGRVLQLLERYDEAIAAYERAIAIEPRHVVARLELAKLLVAAGRLREAAAQYRAVLEKQPGRFEAAANLARISEELGEFDDAARWYTRAAEAAPTRDQQLQIVIKYIRFLATCPDGRLRDPARAVELAEGLASGPFRDDPGRLGLLASVYADVGRTDDAIRTYEKAIESAERLGAPALAEQIRARLRMLRDGEAEPDGPAAPGGAPESGGRSR
jgi:tetratricopeptide (TPR) repeat protein